MYSKIHINMVLTINIFLLTACGGGNGEGLDNNGQPLGSSSALPLVSSLSSIQENVFSINCAIAGCHIPTVAPLGLSLDSIDMSAQLLINAEGIGVTGIKRVEPFDPDNSLLIQKLEGNAGDRMPLGKPPLSPEVIAVIRQWITDGAIVN